MRNHSDNEIIADSRFQGPHAKECVAAHAETVFAFLRENTRRKNGVTVIHEDFDAAPVNENAKMRKSIVQFSRSGFTLVLIKTHLHA